MEATGDSKAKTAAEQSALSDANVLTRKMRTLAPLALRKNPVEGVTPASFNAGGSLGRSSQKMSRYLGNVATPTKKADASFAPCFTRGKVSDLLAAANAALDAADQQQEVAWAFLPPETRKAYETKGRL